MIPFFFFLFAFEGASQTQIALVGARWRRSIATSDAGLSAGALWYPLTPQRCLSILADKTGRPYSVESSYFCDDSRGLQTPFQAIPVAVEQKVRMPISVAWVRRCTRQGDQAGGNWKYLNVSNTDRMGWRSTEAWRVSQRYVPALTQPGCLEPEPEPVLEQVERSCRRKQAQRIDILWSDCGLGGRTQKGKRCALRHLSLELCSP